MQKDHWPRHTNLLRGSAHKGPGSQPPSAAGTATAWRASSWGFAPCAPHGASRLVQAGVYLHQMGAAASSGTIFRCMLATCERAHFGERAQLWAQCPDSARRSRLAHSV